MAARLDAHDTTRGAELDKGAGRWNVDMSRPENSQTFSRTNNDRLPDAFPQSLELYDSKPDYQRLYVETMVRLYVEMMLIRQYLQNLYKQNQPDKPDAPKSPDKPDSSDSGKLSHIPYERGHTIYHDDFNGARGEHPNSKIFDTAHIGPNGQTRQRGENIHEDGIVNTNNTVLDGKGNLEIFAQRDVQTDPVNGETVHYSKGSMNTGKGLRINLKDHPNGVVIEMRAKHTADPAAKFDPLWIMTDDWAADPKKGQKRHDTIEYDAAEAHGADITVHYPYKDASGKTKDEYGGGAHPKDVDFDDGKWHTYTVVIKPNAKTGRGDVVEYVDGKQEFAKESVFPGDKDLHLRSSLEVSPKWTHEKLTIKGGMDSAAAGYIDYLDVSELK